MTSKKVWSYAEALEDLEESYEKLSNPVSGQSVSKIYHYYGGAIPHKTIEEFLESIESYSKYRESRKRARKYNMIFSRFPFENMETDLIVMNDSTLKSNSNVRYLCVYICQFSRKAYVEPMKKKDSASMIRVLKKVYNSVKKSGYKMSNVIHDLGSEYTSRNYTSALRDLNLKSKVPLSLTKTAICERFNRTYQKMIHKYMYTHDTDRYLEGKQVLHRRSCSRCNVSLFFFPRSSAGNHFKLQQFDTQNVK